MRPAAELDDLLQQQADGVITPIEFAACARALYARYAKFPVFGHDLGNFMYPEVIAGTVNGIEALPTDVRVDLNGVAVLLPAKWAGRGAIRLGDRLLVAICRGQSEGPASASFYCNETSGYCNLNEAEREMRMGLAFGRACLFASILVALGSAYQIFYGRLAMQLVAMLALPVALFFALIFVFFRAIAPAMTFHFYAFRSRIAERAPR